MNDPRQEALELLEALRRRLESAASAGIEIRAARRAAAPAPTASPERAGRTPLTKPSGEETRAPCPAVPEALPFAGGAPVLSTKEKAAALERIAAEVRACTKCRLAQERTNAVPGEGSPEARLLFIGEGPGANEDLQGRPFVGRAGELLTKIVESGMGLPRGDVFITNIVKCRPPGNREPEPDEVAACLPYLHRQIEALDPKVIVTLGRPATAALLDAPAPITKIRGRLYRREGRAILPTFHPAYLLRNPAEKPKVWEDIQLAMKELGLPVPKPP